MAQAATNQAVSNKRSFEAAGPFLREIVFGVHDALLTNIGIITGFVTALQDNRLIILAALIDLIISAFAMAFGSYLSRKSEGDYLAGQMEQKDHTDLQDMLGSPVAGAVVMWITYVVSGFIPLIPFFFGLDASIAVRYAVVLCLLVFFMVGLFKGKITGTSPWLSGLQFISFGTVAAAIGYGVGYYGQQLLR